MKKNKKLFAILTLVAFMMTLVPALAFAADAEVKDLSPATIGTITLSEADENGDYTVTKTALTAAEGATIYPVTATSPADDPLTYVLAADAVATTEATSADGYVQVADGADLVALTAIPAAKVLTKEAIKTAQDEKIAAQKEQDKADADAAAKDAAVAGASDIYAVKDSVDVKDNAKVAILLKNADLKETKTIAAGKKLIIWAERTTDTISDVDSFVTGTGSIVTGTIGGYYTVDPSKANATDILLTSSVSGKVTVKAAIVGSGFTGTPDEIKGTNGTKIGSATVEFTPLSQSANKLEVAVKATVNKVEAEAVNSAGVAITDTTKDDVYVGNMTGGESKNELAKAQADSMDKYTVTVTVKAGDNALAGQKVYISANKTGVDLEKTEETTDSRGRVTFDVSATRSAVTSTPYVINVSSGSADDVNVKLSFTPVDAVNIVMVKSPEAPVAVDSTATFKVKATDVYGNNVGSAVVTGKAKIGDKETNMSKVENDGNGNIVFEFTPSKVGNYTATFQLENGKKATTTFEVAEQGKIVEMQLNYDADTVNLGATTDKPEVVQVDAAGVTKTLKSAGSIDFAIQGKGVKELKTDGSISVLTDDKYAGEKLTVTAVDRNKGISAVATLTIAADAQSLAFTGSTAVVGSATNIPFSVVDANGNKVALGKDAVLTVSAVVTDKVEGSNTTATVNKLDDLQTTGVALLEVSSNKEGAAKVQVMVKSETKDDNDKTVVKYYTGVANVTFGDKAVEGANSTATMIIGSTTFVANGKVVTSDVAPFVKDGRTFLPIRALGEAMGAEVAFDEATNVVTIKLDGKTVTMTLGSAVMTVGDKVVTMDTAAYATAEGRTVVPVRFAAEALGFNVEAVYATDGTTSAVNFSK